MSQLVHILYNVIALIDLFVTGGNKVNAFNIVRIIWEIRALVLVCEMRLTTDLCVWRAHNLLYYIQLRDTMKTISLVSLFRNIILTGGIPDMCQFVHKNCLWWLSPW